MVHNNVSLTISQDEAAKADNEAKKRLLAAKKLSLVVDLDQTIIHATVDPTVGEWQAQKDNPNHDAVKDVRSFLLDDDAPGRPGCWYYIKLRPGLENFLKNISEMYELHIYTMGTRAYAKNIAKIIDPDETIFGDRILSRTESGSMTAKNLQRLFPVDTKMVVIIDDRGDVWKWSPNLIKVTPYDFFVGIGDINSSFLPQRPGTQLTPAATTTATPDISKEPITGDGKEEPPPQTNGDSAHHTQAAITVEAEIPIIPVVSDASPLEQLVAMGGSDDQFTRDAQTNSQKETIDKQVKEQPLLKQQQQLEAEDAASESSSTVTNGDADTSDESPTQDDSNVPEKPKHNLLQDNDNELTQLEESLRSVHTEFYKLYRNPPITATGGRLGELRGSQKRKAPEGQSDLDLVPDIKEVLPSVKARVLSGVVLVFSGVVPLGLDVASTEIGVLALSFGARIDEDVSRHTTHVVAARSGTSKINKAKRRRITVVTTQWLLDSVARWAKQDEQQYLLEKGLGTTDHQDDDDPILSESEASLADDHEDETDNDSNRNTPKPNLSIDIHTPRSEGDDAEHEVDFEGVDRSPVGGTNDDWKNMNDELAKFLAEDDEDGEDGERFDDDDSVVSETNSVDSRRGGKGRKRGRDEDDSGAESDRSSVVGKTKRTKQSHLTTLSQTTNVDENEPGANGEEEVTNGKPAKTVAAEINGDEEEEEDEAGWDAFAEQFQKEMEASQSDDEGG